MKFQRLQRNPPRVTRGNRNFIVNHCLCIFQRLSAFSRQKNKICVGNSVSISRDLTRSVPRNVEDINGQSDQNGRIRDIGCWVSQRFTAIKGRPFCLFFLRGFWQDVEIPRSHTILESVERCKYTTTPKNTFPRRVPPTASRFASSLYLSLFFVIGTTCQLLHQRARMRVCVRACVGGWVYGTTM